MEKNEGMNEGEVRLYKLLETLQDEAHKVHANLVIERHKEGTNQIDAMLICKKGVFVFEMKDYNGWIFGNEDNKEWTQILNKGKFGSKKVRFRNPVKQNENHIKTIKHLLNQAGIYVPIINVVVFGEGASLKDVTASVDVVNLNRVMEVIEKYPDMSVDQQVIDTIHTIITENGKSDAAAIAGHISYVESLFTNTNTVSVDAEGKIRKSSNGESVKEEEDVSIGTIIKGSLALIALFVFLAFAIKYPMLLLLGLFLLIPRKRRRSARRRRNSGGSLYGLLFVVICMVGFFGAYGISELRSEVSKDRTDSRNFMSNEVIGKSSTHVSANTEKPKVIFGDEEIESTEPAAVVINTTEIVFEGTTDPDTESVSEPVSEPAIVATTEVVTSPDSYSLSLLLGTKRADVVGVLGEPTNSNGLTDFYKNSTITYDGDGNVIGWKNVYGTLDQMIGKAKGGKLRLGIRSEDVIAALGTPSEIPASIPYMWYYENSYVTFDSDWNVNGWKNTYGELNQAIIAATGGKLSLGMNVEEVINALGSPTEISYSIPQRWQYKNAFVTFNSNWNVNGWKNTYGELNQAFIVAAGGKLALGMSKEDVIVALGTPSEISFTDQYLWYYKNSRITFNSDWFVTGWKNTYGELNSALVIPKGGKLSLGISSDALLEALGTPSEIVHNNPYRWYYKNSSVTFGTDWTVNGWKDVYGELKPSFYNPQGGTLDIGASREDVIRVLGTPTEIAANNQFLWTYKNSTIQFDSNWTILKWKNNYAQFDGVFPGE